MEEGEFKAFASIMDALVRISSNMKSMERELRCPVCTEMVKQPIVLPCQHSVCLLCASGVLARRPAPKADRVDRVLRAGFGTYPGRRRKEGPPPVVLFPCPPCQREVELGERGLADCLRNLTLERIVERYRHTVSLGSVAVMCQFCKPPQALEATKGCADCRSSFCNECFKLYHPWGRPAPSMSMSCPPSTSDPRCPFGLGAFGLGLGVAECSGAKAAVGFEGRLGLTADVLSCPEHEQERLQFYCKSCQRLLCSLCKLRRAHTGHRVTPVAHAYQTLKDKITKAINYILANQDTVQAQMTQLENAITQTEVNSGSARDQLARCVRELGAALDERQGALGQAVEGARLRRVEALAAQVTERRSLLEHAGLLAFSQELLKETDPPCFVQAARLTHSRLMRAVRVAPVLLPRRRPLLPTLPAGRLQGAEAAWQHGLHPRAIGPCDRHPAHPGLRPALPVLAAATGLRPRLALLRGVPPARGGAPGRGAGSGAGQGPGRRRRGPRGVAPLEEVGGTSAVIDRLEMNSVYVLRVRGCNKAGFGEYSEEVYLHTPPAP
ncbi:hypothetical protein ANANG_G00182180, partial [Anguilla anguilla]